MPNTQIPEIGSAVEISQNDGSGSSVNGIVTGFDEKDRQTIVDYYYDHKMPDGTMAKGFKWAWLHQIISINGVATIDQTPLEVCPNCGIQVGEMHMSTCKEWPMRVKPAVAA